MLAKVFSWTQKKYKQSAFIKVLKKMYSEDDESQEESYVNYKQKYRELKKHLRALIYENECLQDELRKAQRNFVSISRDKSFLLDRILKYEKPSGQSSDSDVTESSEEEEDSRTPQYGSPSTFGQRKKITKRKRSEAELSNGGSSSQPMEMYHGHANVKVSKPIPSKPVNVKLPAAAKKQKKPPAARKPSVKKERVSSEASSTSSVHHVMRGYSLGEMHVASEEQVHTGSSDFIDGPHKYEFASEGQMTREDIERHLEARRYSPEMELNTTATVPAELFSQDPEQESDLEDSEICEFVQLEDGTSGDMIME